MAGRGGDRALDLDGRTSLEELAGGLCSCDLPVTNDTGPMHLGAALGTTGAGSRGPGRPSADEAARAPGAAPRPVRSAVRPVREERVPPPRAGYLLTHGRLEGMYLIEIDEVETAVNEMLGEESA